MQLDESSADISSESAPAIEKHGWIEWLLANHDRAGLSKRQGDYLDACFDGTQSFAEIGRTIGLAPRDVRRLHAEVCQRLRRVWTAS